MENETALRRIFMEIAYDGGTFHGWQFQPEHISVQQVIEEAFGSLYKGHEIKLHGSSRTDKGVHALNFVAHADLPLQPMIPVDNLKRALNNILCDEIVIRTVREASPDFHARFDALGKAYTYVVNTGEDLPFLSKCSWHYPAMQDFDAVREALDVLTGTHDFSSFAAEAGKYEDAVRTIFRIDMHRFGDLHCFTFVGDGFLYKMIRSIMGAAAVVGKGRLKAGDVKELLEMKKRIARVETCPPQGLFLMKVFYDQDAMQNFKLESLPFL